MQITIKQSVSSREILMSNARREKVPINLLKSNSDTFATKSWKSLKNSIRFNNKSRVSKSQLQEQRPKPPDEESIYDQVVTCMCFQCDKCQVYFSNRDNLSSDGEAESLEFMSNYDETNFDM